MWVIEAINTLDSNHLDNDGIYARNIDHLWGIFTAPFIHVSWQHLIANTVPFVFMGLIIALQGAKRFALVTVIVIVVGGIGTWLVSPAPARVPVHDRRQRRRVRLRHVSVHAGVLQPQHPRAADRPGRRRGLGRRRCCRASCRTPGSPGRATCAARSAGSSPPTSSATSGLRAPAAGKPQTPLDRLLADPSHAPPQARSG